MKDMDTNSCMVTKRNGLRKESLAPSLKCVYTTNFLTDLLTESFSASMANSRSICTSVSLEGTGRTFLARAATIPESTGGADVRDVPGDLTQKRQPGRSLRRAFLSSSSRLPHKLPEVDAQPHLTRLRLSGLHKSGDVQIMTGPVCQLTTKPSTHSKLRGPGQVW